MSEHRAPRSHLVTVMTVEFFDSLGKRDFENGATRNAIHHALQRRDRFERDRAILLVALRNAVAYSMPSSSDVPRSGVPYPFVDVCHTLECPATKTGFSRGHKHGPCDCGGAAMRAAQVSAFANALAALAEVERER